MPPIPDTGAPPDNTPPSSAPADDLPLAITRAVEQVEARNADPAAAPATAPRHTSSTDGPAGSAPTSQPRDSNGQFAPKDAPAYGQPSVPPSQPAAPSTGSPGEPAATLPTATTPPGAATPEAPPNSWKPEARAKWDKLDPEVRGEIARRERDIESGMRNAAERSRVASAVMAEFEPYSEVLQAEGATPVQAMRTLLQTAYALRSAGPEYRKTIFLQLAQQYNVDLTTGINGELAHAQAALSQHDIASREAAAQYESQQHQAAANVIAQFKSMPGHEHFETVKEIMGNLIATGTVNDLETAYQQAMILHPQTSQHIVNARAAQLARQQSEDEARRRAAASSVGGSLGGFSPPATGPGSNGQPNDIRAHLNAAVDRLGS
jgi:hypothetical protein